jgi:hypothetical protein
MRCVMCNTRLSDKESTLKHPVTGDYLDTCFRCLPGLYSSVDKQMNDPTSSLYDDEQNNMEEFEDSGLYTEPTLEAWLSSDER